MTVSDAAIARGFTLFQRGDLAGASAAIATQLARHPNDPRLAALQGQVLLAAGSAKGAIPYLRTACAAAPRHEGLALKLAQAFAESGAFDDARRSIQWMTSPSTPAHRLLGFIAQQQGNLAQAVAHYRAIVRLAPSDHMTWHILTLLHHNLGQVGEAAQAITQAIRSAPTNLGYRLAQSAILAEAGLLQDRQAALEAATTIMPQHAALWNDLAVTEGMLDRFEASRLAFERAIAADAAFAPAYLERAMLLDRLGRIEELDALIARAHDNGVGANDIAFAEALLYLRKGDARTASQKLALVTDSINPARLAQVRGDVADALGRYDEAFAAYVAMNRASAAEPSAQAARQLNYPAEVLADKNRLVTELDRGWHWATPGQRRSPVFILGFPRSGTTLLDTLLRNVSSLLVLEEPPMVEAAARLLSRDASVDVADELISSARTRYWDRLREFVGEEPHSATTIVDKFPLHMTRVGVIHRLFPDAKIVFVERHPCDVLLSCYFARFQNNKAMVCFQDLLGAARLYDLAMQSWSIAERGLPLRVHHLRYERLTAAPEPELRPLFAFLDLPWTPYVLDNQRAAAARPLIATASYAQVTQPLHTRSVERWRHYQQHLAPIFPIVEPWVRRLGYAL